MKNRIRGMFLGVYIGDSLGMPAESLNAATVKEKFPEKITTYLTPTNQRWLAAGKEAGTFTDDTELTIAVAEGMIESPLNMDAQANQHILSLKKTVDGWGRSTRQSIRRVANGVHWSESAEPISTGAGVGNGVPMKIAPVGAYIWSVKNDKNKIKEAVQFIAQLSMMTHGSSISVSAGLAQAFAIYKCLSFKQGKFDLDSFSNTVLKASELGKKALPETITDDLTYRLTDLFDNKDEYTSEKMIDEFGNGSCYCYNSVPFSLGFFINNPTSIESMYDVIYSGGDTDSNGSMVGALLGALNGEEFFPEHLVSGLKTPQVVLELADRFCEKFEIE